MEYHSWVSIISLFSFAILCALIPLLTSLNLVLLLRPVATRLGLIDVPGGHKRHDHHTPIIGGFAVYLTIVIAAIVLSFLGINIGQFDNVIWLGAIIVFIGGADDRFNLNAQLRLGCQMGLALLMVYWAGVEIKDLGALFSEEVLDLGYISVPFTVIAIVGAMNAINMMDGIDGLIGSITTISIALLIIALLISDSQPGLLVTLLIVFGSVLGFWFHNARLKNRRHARVFMGDSGTMFLGLLTAYFLITLAQGANRSITPASALWIFGLPLLDTLRLMIQRVAKRRSPFGADRLHLHHIFLRSGFTVNQTVLAMSGLQLLMGSCGLVCLYLAVPEAVVLCGFAGVLATYYWLTVRAPRFVRWWKRRLRYTTALSVPGRV